MKTIESIFEVVTDWLRDLVLGMIGDGIKGLLQKLLKRKCRKRSPGRPEDEDATE